MYKINGFESEHNPDAIKKINIEGFQMLSTSQYANYCVDYQNKQFSSEIIKNYLPSNSVFVDVGAHHGYYSLLAYHVHKNSKIIAIEPIKENFEMLTKNIQLNKIENCELHNVSVLERSLDEILRNRKVDFIKIGVQGREIVVLSGLKQTIKNNDKMVMLIEFDPKLQKKAGCSPKILLKTIKKLEYDIFLIDECGKKYIRLTDNSWLQGKWMSDIYKKTVRSANIFCVPRRNSFFVTFFAHSSELYGAERYLLRLIEQLKSKGVLCSVFFPGKGPSVDMFRGKAVACDIIGYNWWNYPMPKNLLACAYVNLIKPLLAAFKANPHIICTNTVTIPWGAISAAFLNKPHIWYVHEFGEKDHGLKFVLKFKKRAKFISFFSDLVIYVSKALQKEYGIYIDKTKNRIIYNTIQIPPRLFREKCQKVYYLKKSLKLIMVGSVSDSKGQSYAIEAVRELGKEGHEVELLILGYKENEYYSKARNIVKSQKIDRIYFKRFIENPFPYIKQADVMLSCSRREAFGRATLEAMILKKPVIGANSGGTVELIKDGHNGFLCEYGNIQSLKDKIKCFIKNRELISTMGSNGYAFAKDKFDCEKETMKNLCLFKDLQNKKSNIFIAGYKLIFAIFFIGIMFSIALISNIINIVKNISINKIRYIWQQIKLK
ncbi:MAG: FkbM family methyltransferase [Candidatus Omnitrophota bacterium]|jgi:glycosyltransferase involved in cell wall biosynthesis